MRFSRLAAVSGFCFCFALTIAAQQQTSPQTQEAIDKAHADMLKSGGDKAAEAGRATEALSRALPRATATTGAIPRKNYIDEQIFGRMERDKIPHAGLASDEEFVRRAYLDATGLLPEPQAVRDFVASKDPNKRDKLDRLADRQRSVHRTVGVVVGGSAPDPQCRLHLLVQAGAQARSAIQRDGQRDPERRRHEDAEQQPGMGRHRRTTACVRASAGRHGSGQLLRAQSPRLPRRDVDRLRSHVPRHQHGLLLVPRRRRTSRAAQPVPDHARSAPSSTRKPPSGDDSTWRRRT